MSTRCNVIIRDTKFGKPRELIFYRHSDGYPAGVAKTLNEFLDLVKTNRIRDNVSQAAGWLIMLGNEEYAAEGGETLDIIRVNTKGTGMHFKVGAYEPSPQISADIEFIYEIDLTQKTLRGWIYEHPQGWNYPGQKGLEITGQIK